MTKIMRCHWVAVGERYGIVSPEGLGVEAILDALIQATPGMIQQVRSQLPKGFPTQVSSAIFSGLQDAARRLAQAEQ